jgi:diguanylate cyclase (GGDEF)-like protein
MKFSLRNLKIRDQMMVLFLPPLVVLLGIIGLFVYNFWLISRSDRSIEISQSAAASAESLLRGINDIYGNAQGYVFTRRDTYLQAGESAYQSVLQDLSSLRMLVQDRSMSAKLDEIQGKVEDWKRQSVDPLIGAVKAGQTLDTMAALRKANDQAAQIREEIGEFAHANQAAATARWNERQKTSRRAIGWGVGLALFFAVLLLALVRAASRQITEPVLQLVRASDRLRQGDFDPALPPETKNEFGVLSRSFLHMVQALRQDREELGAIKRFSEAVTECTSESEVYDQILHALRDRFHPNQVIIFKLRPEEDFLEVVASLKPLPQAVQEWPVIEGKHSCKAVRMGRPFRVNEVGVEPLCPGKFALPEKGSYYCGPLIAGGIIIGAVRLEAEAGFWTPERESLLESYLSTTASVLSNLQLLQTMREQANIDPLTGLYNRRFCKDYARKLMAMARRKNTPLGFIMLDLDHFKNINDVHGHEVGDRILKQFAKTITQSMRETNLTARLGGEEFVVILPDTGAEACLVVAERIRMAVYHMAVPQVKEKPIPPVTVSLGIAVYPEHGGTLEEMLHAADRALYESKRAGRNRSTLYVAEKETTS